MLLNAHKAAAQQEARAHRYARRGKLHQRNRLFPARGEIRFRHEGKIRYSTGKIRYYTKKNQYHTGKIQYLLEKFGTEGKFRRSVVRWFAAAAVARCGLRLGCATQFARSSCCGVVFVYAAATDAANKEFAGLILRANQPGWCLRAAAVAAADADD